ncbi:MAG: ATP-binding cassette domain-containing protein [Bdellovibrionales bacterium]|nr:ATP-binding cassette domain-containing protein [Bdellovibrionales bacterium]
MISTADLSLAFGGRKLFENVSIKFVAGNCYGLIGANGSGKSTFLKILAGQETPSSGEVAVTPGERLSFLRQDHFAFEEHKVLKTVIMGQPELYKLMEEREALYAKDELSDEDGERIGDLEMEFADLNGWEAEADAAILLDGLGIGSELIEKKMKELDGAQKVKVLLAQALFGKPDILLLDEPTNHLDAKAIRWLEEFLYDNEKTVIVVSHDRHFLNKVCTHIADLDFGKIQLYSGNYDFWYESSQLALRMQQEQNRKVEEKAKELKEFIARFSANASKSKQATSRKKLLEKLTLDDIKPSSRRYPYVHFKPEREAGDQLLKVENLYKSVEGQPVLNNVSFELRKGDKVLFTGDELATSMLFRVLVGEDQADKGGYAWGVTTSQAYFPKDNAEFFRDGNLSLADWLRQFSEDTSENFIRGILGRMLFSGDESQKKVKVLSGGERVRLMLAKMMLTTANVLLLDGPTNHLDLESITAVNNGLIRFSGTVLFTSHDHQFNQTIANRVIELGAFGATLFDMSYDEYLTQQA